MIFSILKRGKNTLKVLSIVLISLVLFILTSVFVLIGTDKGFYFFMDQASEMSSGALNFSQIEGNLLGHLMVTDFSYADNAMDVSVHKFVFNWQPAELVNKNLLLETFEIVGVNYNQLIAPVDKTEDNPDEQHAALLLPEINLPIDIILQKLQISDVNLTLEPGAETVHINAITLRSELINTKLNVQKLSFQMPEVQALVSGTVELYKHYPLKLLSDIKITLPEQPELTIMGKFSGDIEELNIKQQIGGLLDASIDAQATQLLDKLAWTSDIVLTHFNVSHFLPENSEIISAQINAKGDLAQAKAQIKTRVHSKSNKTIAEKKEHIANIESLSQETQILIDADVTFANQKFNTNAQWKNLQWPLSGVAAFASKSGSMDLSGTADDYTLAMQLLLSGSDLPEGDWQTHAKGGLSKINIDSLRGVTLNGVVDIAGAVSWGDSTQWQVKLESKEIDPGQFAKKWPGSINMELQSQGQLSGEQLNAHVVLEQFSGHLRKQPLTGGGEFELLNQSVNINHFNLSSGDAKIAVDGKLDEQLDLNWLLDIKNLSDLLPDSRGNIIGQGHIAGTIKQPAINARLEVKNIVYEGIKLKFANLDAAVNTDISVNSDLDLSAQELSIDPENSISKLGFSLHGPLENHHIKLSVDHTMAALNLVSNGQLDIDKSSWDGTISKLSIDSPDFGQWILTKAVDLYASAEQVVLSALCLKEQSTVLCAEADWTPEKGQAKLNLNNLSFEQARPYLPEEISHLSGALQLDADIDLAPQLLANVNVEIKPGKLVYQTLGGESIELPHRNGLLITQYDMKQLSSKWNIDIGPHTMGGNLNISRDAIEKDPLTAPMHGQVKINIKDFDILTRLVPQINKIDGHLLTDLKLGGLLGEPRVTGHAELIAPYVEIQDLGLNLKNISLNVDGKNNGRELVVNGNIDSGKGQLKVDGQVILDAEQGWPITFDLKGDDFLAINIPDFYAVISPDINFSQKQELMQLNGNLLIPEATIAPSSMRIPEGVVSHSNDIVIIGEEKKQPANMAIDLTLALGDKVKIDAYGLKTYLTGKITVKQIPKRIMTARGQLNMKKGTFRAYGQDLSIEKGKVYYAGGFLDNPGIELRAIRRINTDQVGISVTGSAKENEINTFSDDPTLSEKDRVSLLLTGQKSENLDAAKVYAGTQINEKLSVGVNAGMGDEGSEFVTRYSLTDDIQLEGTSSSTKSGGSILYIIEVE